MISPWEVRRNILYLIMTAAIIFIFVAAVALVVIGSSSDDDSDASGTYYVTADGGSDTYTLSSDEESDFLTSTALTIGVDQSKVISPISELMLDYVTYSSTDTDYTYVKMTVSDGLCTVTGVTATTDDVTITCTYTTDDGTYTSECTVTVVSSTTDSELNVYDVKGTGAYATLASGDDDTDDGFAEGLISLTFNSASGTYTTGGGFGQSSTSTSTNYILINLCGTESGNWLNEYSTIKMYLSGGSTTYSWTYSTNPFTPGAQFSSDIMAEFSIPTAILSNGTTYTVTFDLYTSSGMFASSSGSVSGTFTYYTSSDSRDMNGVFTRAYSWSYNGTGYTGSFTMSYYEYYMEAHTNYGYCEEQTVSSYTYFTNRDLTSDSYSDTLERVAVSDAITESVYEMFVSSYGDGWSSLSDSDKAQFILAFVQINFTYAYDTYQYGDDGTSTSSTEYWAYSTETIWAGAGDCEDTSILAAVLFREAGLDSGVYLVPGHAIAAVALDDYDAEEIEIDSSYSGYGVMSKTVDGSTYYGCETTVELYIPVGRITQSATVNGTTYNFCDTTASWSELYIISE